MGILQKIAKDIVDVLYDVGGFGDIDWLLKAGHCRFIGWSDIHEASEIYHDEVPKVGEQV